MYVDLYGDGIGKVEYVQHMGTDLTIVNSARVSFGKTKAKLDKRDKRLIKYLAGHKHTSTFEHNVATFRFTVPLYIRSQHHRHRTWSYNEISRRYTDIDISFYEPEHFRTQHDSNRQASNVDDPIDPILEIDMFPGNKDLSSSTCVGSASMVTRLHNANSIKIYDALIDSGVCREQARGVLPQNMYTKYYGTVNLNNLIKFVDLRLEDGAQFEIQMVAKACLSMAHRLWPFAIDSYIDSKGLDKDEVLVRVEDEQREIFGQKLHNSEQ